MKASDVKRELAKLADPAKAELLAGYFKTGKGEYGEGDSFLGITVPKQRAVGKRFTELPFSEIAELLKSKIHEHRFTALEILVFRYEKAVKEKNKDMQKSAFEFYLSHTAGINNWDLVDCSTPYLVGEYLAENNLPVRKRVALLAKLASSKNIWERRIAILATFAFIKRGHLDDTFALCELLMKDEHDLIHKACGWALREAGKKDEKALEKFLQKHTKEMPRTMLRYAVEKFPEEKRKKYLTMKR